MSYPDTFESFAGKCLISMPDMADQRFQSSVIFLCAHSSTGAMGLIVNKRVDDVNLDDLMDQLSIPKGEDSAASDVHFGGPVEHGRGFVLHTSDYRSELSTMEVSDEISMTATIDILEDIGAKRGPKKALIALGYAGWGRGQLEAEIAQNGWLIAETEIANIFDLPDRDKWKAALGVLGVNPAILSSRGGRA